MPEEKSTNRREREREGIFYCCTLGKSAALRQWRIACITHCAPRGLTSLPLSLYLRPSRALRRAELHPVERPSNSNNPRFPISPAPTPLPRATHVRWTSAIADPARISICQPRGSYLRLSCISLSSLFHFNFFSRPSPLTHLLSLSVLLFLNFASWVRAGVYFLQVQEVDAVSHPRWLTSASLLRIDRCIGIEIV